MAKRRKKAKKDITKKSAKKITLFQFLTFVIAATVALIELNRFIATQNPSPLIYVFANVLFFIILFIAALYYKVFYNRNDEEVENE
ncbi:MAG TPA: hypothetical protein VI564_02995 [Candidatus Nanoarchaeia archaeon]|nr:hypothetical protein [Candidatus Nanoarchaeia archaeon]